MKEPTSAPAYVGLYPVLCEAARAKGYALAVHGSVARDFDLIAVPWTDEAVSAEELIRAIVAAVDFTRDRIVPVDRLFSEPYFADKPHGRKAWSIPLDCGAVLDVSVTPQLAQPNEE